MRILLTNDDGVYADGLHALRRALERLPGAQVAVVAPDRERSACGHSITVHRPIHVDQVQMPDATCPIWGVTGTPADCVKLAIEALLPDRPDLVISGINRGSNLGTDVFYSGTVSAAIEASFYELQAIAVSLDAFRDPDYGVAADFLAWLAPRLANHPLPSHTLLNINVPAVEPAYVAGVRLTRLGVRRYRDVFDRREDPRGRAYYWLAGEVVEGSDDPDTDVTAVKRNLISITPIQLDLTDRGLLREMAAWGLEGWTSVAAAGG